MPKILYVAVRQKSTKSASALPKVAVFPTSRSAGRWAADQPTPYEVVPAKMMPAPRGRPKVERAAKPKPAPVKRRPRKVLEEGE